MANLAEGPPARATGTFTLLVSASYLLLTFLSVLSLYVGSLNFALTESDIRQVFQPFGEVEVVDLHKDPVTGKSKGYAFVQFVFSFACLRCSSAHLAVASPGSKTPRMLFRLSKR